MHLDRQRTVAAKVTTCGRLRQTWQKLIDSFTNIPTCHLHESHPGLIQRKETLSGCGEHANMLGIRQIQPSAEHAVMYHCLCQGDVSARNANQKLRNQTVTDTTSPQLMMTMFVKEQPGHTCWVVCIPEQSKNGSRTLMAPYNFKQWGT